MMKFQRFIVLFLFGSLALTACGDDETNLDPVVRVDPQPTPPPDNNNQEPEPEPEPEALVFQAVSELTQEVEANAEVELKVELVGSRTGAGRADETIRFTVLQAPTAAVTLSASSVQTDDLGQAAVMLQVGEVAGPIVVRAAYPGLAPVEFEVRVKGLPGGSIRVEIQRPTQGPGTLSPFKVRAYPSSMFACANFPRRIDTAGYAAGVQSQGLLATLTDVAVEETYTVTVQAMGNGNIPVATGCVNTVSVQSEETTSVIVPLELLPLDPTGVYDVLGYWDLTQAIAQSGQAGDFLIGLLAFMDDPGQYVYDLIVPALESATGISNLENYLALLGVRDLVRDTVNDFVYQFAGFLEFQAIAQGLQSMLNNLEVESELVINKTEDDFSFTGYEHWQKVILYFSWQCDSTSPPDCGRYELPVAANGQIQGLGHVSYDWTGNVENYNQLNLYSIETRFDYGALMVTILEQVVIPELTGGNANSVAGFLVNLVDCPGIATSISSGAGSSSLLYSVVNAACTGVVTQLANEITQPLQNLQVEFDLELDGTATLIDGQSAGFVDEIQNGLNLGTVVSTQAPVTVEWSATLNTL